MPIYDLDAIDEQNARSYVPAKHNGGATMQVTVFAPIETHYPANKIEAFLQLTRPIDVKLLERERDNIRVEIAPRDYEHLMIVANTLGCSVQTVDD